MLPGVSFRYILTPVL
ncbi:unnamed protein product [Linum tenue]|uniref:Uncharacterized protein n=1 Tax=Linum tenue TaxID=586396 RepID=A0AAV0KKY9_9ROSI|nr:unnamed protein product [Linum tenue]